MILPTLCPVVNLGSSLRGFWRRLQLHINVCHMTSDSGGTPTKHGFDPLYSDIKTLQMGELARGEDRWDVLLETVRDQEIEAVRGRMHFVSGGNTHLWSSWIFLEWSSKEIEARFNEFSPQELWTLLDSLPK